MVDNLATTVSKSSSLDLSHSIRYSSAHMTETRDTPSFVRVLPWGIALLGITMAAIGVPMVLVGAFETAGALITNGGLVVATGLTLGFIIEFGAWAFWRRREN